ncbi:MAG: glycoside hydrolase family 26 protein, partial [Tannerella sp.]|nr:glycoside hydrolase family 26 protein [Tannerella sp.]
MKKLFLFLAIISLTACWQVQKEKRQTAENVKLPVDTAATAETVALYNRLFRLLDSGIMVGHQDDLAYGHSWYKEAGRSDVKDVTGDYPAVAGWELGHLEIGAEYNLDSVYFADMKQYIREHYDRGGVTTISWHGDNIVTGLTAWDCKQDSVVRTVLPGGSNHEKYLIWLDRLAAFFDGLKDAEGKAIPVIFRMYHEHSGNWFWWGSEQCMPEEYKQLWRMTVEYLRDTKNVHHLLYAYSPSETRDETHFLERYPGNEYVDIVGFDCYAGGKDSAAIARYGEALDRNLQIVTSYAQKSGKIPTIGETGMESVPYTTYFTQAVYPVIGKYKISWVLFWRNSYQSSMPQHFYVPFAGHPSAPDFKQFTDKDNIL